MTPTPALNAALAQLQGDLPQVSKSKTADVPTKTGGKYSYTYADLAAVSEAIMPRLGPLGLAFTARPTLEAGNFVLAYELRHESGEEIGGFYPLGRGTPQVIGGEITYARRYALCSVTGVVPEDDDDAAAASAQPTTARRRQAQQGDVPQRTAQRAARPAEPPLPGERGHGTAGGPAMATPAQMGKLHAAFNALGIADRDERLGKVTDIVRRSVGSSKDLTKAEASKVIDELGVMAAGTARSEQSAAGPADHWWDEDGKVWVPNSAGVDPAEFAS